MKFNNIIILSLLLLTVSCEIYPQDEYKEEYVVESYLVANRELPSIRLSTTVPAGEEYDFTRAAVTEADVEVRLLTDGPYSEIEQTFNYSLISEGIFRASELHVVEPSRTYELFVTIPGSDTEISAHTFVPGTFQISEELEDTVVYQSEGQFEITVSGSDYPGRQNIFIFNTLSQKPVAENLTPFFKNFYEDGGEDPEDLQSFANSSSGILNEANFSPNTDGSFTILYPWIGFSFYEDNLLVVNTIDDNIYDFIRSQSVQLGGSTLSPGEIQNVITHVKGGVGVFGALASDTTDIYVARPQ